MPSKAELRRQWDNAGKDVVVLHQFDRARTTPNASPFPIKMETYLRMAGIKYVNDFKQPIGSKGKSPWMTFNGTDMADSQLCMEHLAKVLDKDMSAHLSPEEKAVARGMRAIIEDHFYFCMVMERWSYIDLDTIRNEVFAPFSGIPSFLVGFFLKRVGKQVKAQAVGQGIGRHTKDEVRAMGMQDMKALSDFLGDKPFMMGDKPTELDCVLFGFTCQILYTMKPDHLYRKALETDLVNLKEHMLRVKAKYWPDWDDCLYKEPGKKDSS